VIVVVVVKVTDDNDHSPTFDADIYEFSVEENNQLGAVLFHVTANDLDIGDNADSLSQSCTVFHSVPESFIEIKRVLECFRQIQRVPMTLTLVTTVYF